LPGLSLTNILGIRDFHIDGDYGDMLDYPRDVELITRCACQDVAAKDVLELTMCAGARKAWKDRSNRASSRIPTKAPPTTTNLAETGSSESSPDSVAFSGLLDFSDAGFHMSGIEASVGSAAYSHPTNPFAIFDDTTICVPSPEVILGDRALEDEFGWDALLQGGQGWPTRTGGEEG
jgi:hypothetical protein